MDTVKTKKITAEEARTISESLAENKFMHRLYKEIDDASHEGMVAITWDCTNYSAKLLDKVVANLKEDKFYVNLTSEMLLSIRW